MRKIYWYDKGKVNDKGTLLIMFIVINVVTQTQRLYFKLSTFFLFIANTVC